MGLDGGQAEYVRIPYADSTVFKAPENVPDQALLLMADIFPTGYYGVKSATELAATIDISDAVVVVVGCGPVGLCATACAVQRKPRQVFAVDSVESRLEVAHGLGAEPLNFKTDPEGMRKKILDATDGRGADIVVEVVGHSSALRTAFELIRPFGVISSIGVHNGEVALVPIVVSEIDHCLTIADSLDRKRGLWVRYSLRDSCVKEIQR